MRSQLKKIPFHHHLGLALSLVVALFALIFVPMNISASMIPGDNITIDSPISGTETSNPTIVVSGGCYLLGISDVTIGNNEAVAATAPCEAAGGGVAKYSAQISLVPGENRIRSHQKDRDGNWQSSNPVSVTYNAPASVLNAPTITSPSSNQRFTTAALTVRGSDCDSGNTVTIYKNGQSGGSGSCSGSGTFAVGITLSSGANSLTARQSNADSQSRDSASVVVYLDNAGGGGNGSSPANEVFIPGTTNKESDGTTGGTGTSDQTKKAASTAAETAPLLRLAKQVPPELAAAFPYILLALLALNLVVLGTLTLRYYEHMRELKQIWVREQAMAKERDNFLAIASHSLRTPMAVISGNAELLGKSTNVHILMLQSWVATMVHEVETILGSASQEPIQMKDIPKSDVQTPIIKTVTSPLFWVPFTLAGGLIYVSNYVFTQAGVLSESQINYWTQTAAMATLAIITLGLVHFFYLRREYRRQAGLVFSKLEQLQTARHRFIVDTVASFKRNFKTVERLAGELPANKARQGLLEGCARLEKLLLNLEATQSLTNLTADAPMHTGIVSKLAAESINKHLADISAKQLKFKITGKAILREPDHLLQKLLEIVIENAVKYANPHTLINIGIKQSMSNVSFRISNSGNPISADVLEQLFQPFSKAEDVVSTTGNEGLGLGLYQAKIITGYMGGKISIASKKNGLTTLNLKLPVRAAHLHRPKWLSKVKNLPEPQTHGLGFAPANTAKPTT